MIRAVTIDGTEYRAQDAADLVHQLHESSYSPCDSDEEFMDEMATRVKMTMGREVSSACAEDFVSDLISVGFLKEKRPDEDK